MGEMLRIAFSQTHQPKLHNISQKNSSGIRNNKQLSHAPLLLASVFIVERCQLSAKVLPNKSFSHTNPIKESEEKVASYNIFPWFVGFLGWFLIYCLSKLSKYD